MCGAGGPRQLRVPGESTPSADPTGVLAERGVSIRGFGTLASAVRAVFSAPQAKKILGLEVPNQRFSLISERWVKLYRMLRNAANADAHTNSWRSESTIYGLLLLLLPLLLLSVCQQPCSRAPGTHRRPNSTRIVLARRFRDVLTAPGHCAVPYARRACAARSARKRTCPPRSGGLW